jgi:Centromere kinetochore component CENP-T histone fold
MLGFTDKYRQRQINDHSTVFSVAQKHLPGELLQAVRMPPAPVQGKKRKRLAAIAEEE